MKTKKKQKFRMPINFGAASPNKHDFLGSHVIHKLRAPRFKPETAIAISVPTATRLPPFQVMNTFYKVDYSFTIVNVPRGDEMYFLFSIRVSLNQKSD